MGASNYAENKMLDVAWATPRYLQLHTGDPGEDCTANVVSTARQGPITVGAAASGTLSNTVGIEFPNMPAVSVVAWSVWDVAGTGTPPTGGNPWWYGWFNPSSGTNHGTAQVDDEDLTNNDIESPTHGLAANDRVYFEALEGFTVPTGLTAGTLYHVIATGLADDIFRVSTSQGGAAVDITAEGQAIWRRVSVLTTTLGQILRISAGDLDVFLD